MILSRIWTQDKGFIIWMEKKMLQSIKQSSIIRSIYKGKTTNVFLLTDGGDQLVGQVCPINIVLLIFSWPMLDNIGNTFLQKLYSMPVFSGILLDMFTNQLLKSKGGILLSPAEPHHLSFTLEWRQLCQLLISKNWLSQYLFIQFLGIQMVGDDICEIQLKKASSCNFLSICQ